MIILEGLDAVGKTTIANHLATELGCKVSHSKKPTDGWFEYVERSKQAEALIFDRFHIGEVVWPVIFDDGRKPMLRWQQHMIERILLQRNALLVFMHGTFYDINSRLVSRGEEPISHQTYEQRFYLFNDAVKGSIIPSIGLGDPLANINYTINTILSAYAKRYVDIKNLKQYRATGSIVPGAIMVVGFKDYKGLSLFDTRYAPLSYPDHNKNLGIALQLSGHTSHYLTYFKKTGGLINDKKALLNEYIGLRPRKVVCIDEESFSICKTLLTDKTILATYNNSNTQYAEFFK